MGKTKELILSLRAHLKIENEVHNLLYGEERAKQRALKTIKFYNQAKQIILRSGGDDKIVNLKILKGLLSELRVRLDITKQGLAADKVNRAIEFGGKKSAH